MDMKNYFRFGSTFDCNLLMARCFNEWAPASDRFIISATSRMERSPIKCNFKKSLSLGISSFIPASTRPRSVALSMWTQGSKSFAVGANVSTGKFVFHRPRGLFASLRRWSITRRTVTILIHECRLHPFFPLYCLSFLHLFSKRCKKTLLCRSSRSCLV